MAAVVVFTSPYFNGSVLGVFTSVAAVTTYVTVTTDVAADGVSPV